MVLYSNLYITYRFFRSHYIIREITFNGGCVTLDVSGMKPEPDSRKIKVSLLRTKNQAFVEKLEKIISTFTTKTADSGQS